jgi:hypothetical protein
MSIISRGFRGRRQEVPADRVPPGQYVTWDFPVLSAGPTRTRRWNSGTSPSRGRWTNRVVGRGTSCARPAQRGGHPRHPFVTKWTDTRLLASSRSWDDIIYRAELERLAGGGLTVVHTLTASRPPGWDGYARRVDAAMLAEVGPSPDEQPRVYVCGPTPFVEAVAEALVTLGHEPARIKTERFGPTGD